MLIDEAKSFYQDNAELLGEEGGIAVLMASFAQWQVDKTIAENERLREENKVLAQRLEAAERFNALTDLIDVDADGIFNVYRNGKLIGYGATAKDAIYSAHGFEIENKRLQEGQAKAPDLTDEICVCGHEKRLHGVDDINDCCVNGIDVGFGKLEGDGVPCECMKFQNSEAS